MLKKEVKIGTIYFVRLHGVFTNIEILREYPYGGWVAKNLKTGREVRIKSAGKLRSEVK